MRFNKLDLNLLVALDALLSTKNVSRAAERLHITQSATSNALARLREHFDDDLLVPLGRQMELTARAHEMADAIRDILVRIETTVEARPVFVPAESERLFRLLISDYTLMTLIPKLIARAFAEAPGVRFEFVPQVAHPQKILERGETDVLIVPQEYCSTEHPSEILFQDSYCAVVWKESELARGVLTAQRYLAAGHVVIQPRDGKPALDDWFVQRLGLVRRVEMSTFMFSSAAHLVVGTERIATTHRHLASQVALEHPVVMRELPFQMPVINQALQWHTYRTADPGVAWLRDLLRSAAKDLVVD
ncbi:LysR family transcriptional regulator [Pseudomonas oryzihabitans]|uniref:LysR family transcriptional regulator n=1 Tax=Pseudomonas oryzihabitans TaxID=47885 RepID=UPI00111EF08E|nr:LysR family transcriptional regulator [Pseudomonas psychrotolerans]QDD91866.1 nodulation protein NfeD [Pseudomonas psychrotolerans]